MYYEGEIAVTIDGARVPTNMRATVYTYAEPDEPPFLAVEIEKEEILDPVAKTWVPLDLVSYEDGFEVDDGEIEGWRAEAREWARGG